MLLERIFKKANKWETHLYLRVLKATLSDFMQVHCCAIRTSHLIIWVWDQESLALQTERGEFKKSSLTSCLAIPIAISDPVNPDSHSLHKLARSSQD